MRIGVPVSFFRHQVKRSENPRAAAPPRPAARRAPLTPPSPSPCPEERADPERRGVLDPHALGWRALAEGDRALELAQLEVFQERVRGRKGREREAGRAVEEAEAQERAVEELPEDARGQKAAGPFPRGPLRLGGERRVTVELLEVMREVAVGAVEDGFLERLDGARGQDLLVNGIVREPRAHPVVQARGPHDRVAPEEELAPEKLEADGDAVRGGRGGLRRRGGEAGANLEGELRRDDLVRVDREDPAVRRERRRRVLLPAEAVEGPHEDPGAGLPRDLLGAVGRRGVHDDDALVRERDGGEGAGKAILLVPCDERDAEARLFRGRHRLLSMNPGPPYTPRP